MSTKDQVYGAFIDYYGDIPVTKIKEEKGFVVYATRVSTSLNELRYIFVVVPVLAQFQGLVQPNPERTSLNNLDWVSFQTRITDDYHKIPSISLELTENKKRAMMDELYTVGRTLEKTEYLTRDLPIKITLLHNQRKNNSLQYPDSCALYKALETYQCVVDLM